MVAVTIPVTFTTDAVTMPVKFILDADISDADISVTVILGLPVNDDAVVAVPVKDPVNVVAFTLVTDIVAGSLELLTVPDVKSVAFRSPSKLDAVIIPEEALISPLVKIKSPSVTVRLSFIDASHKH